jgi:hypothetical protein
MSLKLTLAALTLLATAPAAFAVESLVENREIDGRPVTEIISILGSNGIDATSIENWRGELRVYARNDDGETYVVLVDGDTLRPIEDVRAVGTNLDVGTAPTVVRSARTADGFPESLSTNYDD